MNRVGVDLNTASFALLQNVAGINERTAQKIVEFRNEHGAFRSRVQLMAVPGFGPKTFEQAAGFLRIRNGENPLDGHGGTPGILSDCGEYRESLNVEIATIGDQPTLLVRSALKIFKIIRPECSHCATFLKN